MKLTEHQRKVLLAVADGTISKMNYNTRTWSSLQSAGLVTFKRVGRYRQVQELTAVGKNIVDKIKKANGLTLESPDHL